MHHDNVEGLDITRKTGQVLSKSPTSVQIMDSHSYETLEAQADEQVMSQISEGDEIIFIDYNNTVKVLEKK